MTSRATFVATLTVAIVLGTWAIAPVSARTGLFLAPDAAVQATAPVDRTAIRARYITVNLDAFPAPDPAGPTSRQPDLTLDLFPDVAIRAVFDRFDPNTSGVTWVGHADGVPMSTVTLVYQSGLLAGSIAAAGHVYSIRPAPMDVRLANPQPGRELHLVTEVDQNAFPREAAPVEVRTTAPARADATVLADSAQFIDVMVVYTPFVELANGGATPTLNSINLAVSETNTSYLNSGITQRLRLVHTEKVPYVEGNSFSQILLDVSSGTNGLSGVAGVRDTFHADVVTLLVRAQAPDACGIGFIMTTVNQSFAPFAYNVVDASCLPNYTYPHELGHNMGTRHDWFVDSAVTPFAYGHGYVNPAAGQRWRTIMAYPDLCLVLGFGCTRVLYWANPTLQYVPYCTDGSFDCSKLKFWYFPGSAMGVAAGTNTTCRAGSTLATNCDADDVRVLNSTALTVANFRASGSVNASVK